MMQQRTVFQTHDPADGDKDVVLVAFDGILLTPPHHVPVTLNGVRYTPPRARVDIDTSSSETTIVATVLLLANDGS